MKDDKLNMGDFLDEFVPSDCRKEARNDLKKMLYLDRTNFAREVYIKIKHFYQVKGRLPELYEVQIDYILEVER